MFVTIDSSTRVGHRRSIQLYAAALVVSWSPLLASGGAVALDAWTHPNGHPRCPCVSPPFGPPLGPVPADNECRALLPSVRASLHDPAMCLSPKYGDGRCGRWDEVGYTGDRSTVWSQCASASPPSWCSASWCWVDPANCDRSSTRADANSFNATVVGESLYYSYHTCGNLDGFNADNHKANLVTAGKNGALRVSFPGPDSNLYSLVYETDDLGDGLGAGVRGGANLTIRESGMAGSLPWFFADAMAALGIVVCGA